MNTLGNFSWQSLQNDVKQLLLDKVDCLFSYILPIFHLYISQGITFFRRLAQFYKSKFFCSLGLKSISE